MAIKLLICHSKEVIMIESRFSRVLYLLGFGLNFFEAARNVLGHFFISEKAPLKDTIATSNRKQRPHVILPVDSFGIFEVPDEGLAAWGCSPSHKVIVNFDNSLFPATGKELIVW
jgi:hypothetical protein